MTALRLRLQVRRRTASDWVAQNEVLLAGEIGYETDTAKFKIGDGTSAWNAITEYYRPAGAGGAVFWGDLGGTLADQADLAAALAGKDPAGAAAAVQALIPVNTDDLAEGAANLYHTAGRASAAAPVQSVNGQTGALSLTANDVGAIAASEKGAANGVTPLDGTGKVAAVYLPSYVDDVLEAADFASLPAVGEAGKIYITLADNAQYRWSGSAYVSIVSSPGSTDAVPEGAANLYFTESRAAAAAPVQSVNGRTGAFSLAAADVGAEPANAVADHVALADPHPGKYAPTASPTFTGIARWQVGSSYEIYNVGIAGGANFERGFMRWNANVLEIGTEKGGTGTQRSLRLRGAAATGHSLLLDANGFLWGEFAGSTAGRGYLWPGASRIGVPHSGATHGPIGRGWSFHSTTGNDTVGLDVLITTATNTKVLHGFGSGGKDASAINTGDGHDCDFFGGNGSSVTTGGAGGFARLLGGDAKGTGNNNGGDAIITPGLPTGTGNPGKARVTAPLVFANYTVATLPSAIVCGIGARSFVTDALAPMFGAAVTGGGAVPVPVYSDGSIWRVG